MKDIIIEEDAAEIVNRVDMSELEGKELLLTGASGLVGTYFLYSLKAYVESGKYIKNVNIVYKNNLPNFLDDFRSYSWIKVWQGDLCDDEFVKSLPKCDYIIHGAGYGQPAKFVVDEAKTLKLNTAVTLLLFEKLNDNGKFLFISSSGVYNGLQKEVYSEIDIGTTNTLHPRACYIEGKRCGEAICNSFRKKGFEAKAARLSYTYGPGVRLSDERALYAFIKKGMEGEISLLDDGSAERIYCYVADVVEILWNILFWGKEPIYNVGAKERITILELAYKIGEILKVPVRVPQLGKGILGNASLERLDITKIENEFHKDNFISLDIGLKKTIEWMKIQSNKTNVF